MFKQFDILNSYTLESTFYAPLYPRTMGRRQVKEEDQIKACELVDVGADFCQTLTAIVNSKISKRKFTVDTNIHYLY